ICKTSGGQFEYRGVRLSDGAKLIVAASQSGDGFAADNNGITYTVTAKSLVISQGGNVIREEQMVDFHRPDAPVGPGPAPATTTPTTPLPPPLPAHVRGGRSRRRATSGCARLRGLFGRHDRQLLNVHPRGL